ncbi:DUF7935 family protein [Neolewinella litorea]|uniref:Uncharacterized protein n=1 Tax=Neolewinella litorea TaxID=2562452 RepID=A0A4S4NIC7_9BACT|nr:hypothetical protein [Neolewinella litorea]THH37961.1 hypothetical protein E4021_13085 [Neolewinella litorea]
MLNILLWTVPVVLTVVLVWLLGGVLTRFREAVTALERKVTAPAPAQQEADPVDPLALRLQACERFTLMLERISVPNLLLRLPPHEETPPREYRAELLLAIRQEVEYNITQQIYVSDSLWSIITHARDNISLQIARAAEEAESSRHIADRLRMISGQQEENPIALAQGAIRREAASVLTR